MREDDEKIVDPIEKCNTREVEAKVLMPEQPPNLLTLKAEVLKTSGDEETEPRDEGPILSSENAAPGEMLETIHTALRTGRISTLAKSQDC